MITKPATKERKTPFRRQPAIGGLPYLGEGDQ